MQLPRLEMHNTFAQIGISQEQATTEMRQPWAEVRMNQPQPEVEYYIKEGELHIDQTEAFADANLMHPFRNIREWVQRCKQIAIQNLAKTVQEGNRLMKIEDYSGTIIPQLAKEASEPEPKEFTLGYIPESADKVKFYYYPGELKIDVKENDFFVKITPRKPIIKFHPGNLQIYLRQKENLKINVIYPRYNEKI